MSNDERYRELVEKIEMYTLSAKSSLDTGDMLVAKVYIDLMESGARELERFMECHVVGGDGNGY